MLRSRGLFSSTADLSYVTCKKKTIAAHADVVYNGLVQSSKSRIKRKSEINQLFGKMFPKCIKLFHLDKLFSPMANSQKHC